jgi:hypothetical protein
MALVTLSNAIIPANYAAYQSLVSVELLTLFNSGILQPVPELAAMAAAPGYGMTVPAWNALDTSVEPNYGTDNPADIAAPLGLTSIEWFVRKTFWNQAWAAARLVGPIIGADPMAEIARQTGQYWARRLQKRLAAIAIGVYNANIANNNHDMIVDVSSSGAAGTATTANQWSHALLTSAMLTMGEWGPTLGAMIVDPYVFKSMQDQQLIQFQQPANVGVKIPYYADKLVFVTEDLPTVPSTGDAKHLSIVFAPNAFGWGTAEVGVPQQFYDQPLQGNGEGVLNWVERKHFIMHATGHTFTNAQLTNGHFPSDADSAVAANWNRVTPRKLVPQAFIITN